MSLLLLKDGRNSQDRMNKKDNKVMTKSKNKKMKKINKRILKQPKINKVQLQNLSSYQNDFTYFTVSIKMYIKCRPHNKLQYHLSASPFEKRLIKIR